jgi:hypothetical protein
MEPAGYWDALDRLAGAYGKRNRLDARRAASLANGIIALALAAVSLYAGARLLGGCYAGVAVTLLAMALAARRGIRRCEREIAVLRVFILRSEPGKGKGAIWTH